MRPNDAFFISDPTDRAFEACLGSHSWLETILLADRNARRGENSFNDENYDRFYNQAAAILIRQLSDAATDVGSFWLTASINPAPPQLPHCSFADDHALALSPHSFITQRQVPPP